MKRRDSFLSATNHHTTQGETFMKTSTIIIAIGLLFVLPFASLFAQEELEKKFMREPTKDVDAQNPYPNMQPEMCINRSLADNFAAPLEPTSMSPGLAQFITQHYPTIKPRQFDEPGCDRPFAMSCKLKKCCISYMKLEIRMKKEGCQYCNDAIYVGVAPFAGPNMYLFNYLWCNPPCSTPCNTAASPITKTYVIPVAAHNAALCTPGDRWLDIFIQDDTNIDYVKLYVWYTP